MFSGWHKEETCVTHFFFFFFLVKKKKGHPTSSTLSSAVHTQYVPAISFYSHSIFFFLKINHIVLISSRFSCTACHSPLSSVWSLSSSAPWKPSASWQKCTSAHTRPYSLQKGPKHLDLLFFFLPQQLLAGMAKHKTGSVWQKPLLFIDWQTRMTEWLTHLH